MEQAEPLPAAEVRTAEAAGITSETNEPSSKRQKLSHTTTIDERDRKQGIAPIKPELVHTCKLLFYTHYLTSCSLDISSH